LIAGEEMSSGDKIIVIYGQQVILSPDDMNPGRLQQAVIGLGDFQNKSFPALSPAAGCLEVLGDCHPLGGDVAANFQAGIGDSVINCPPKFSRARKNLCHKPLPLNPKPSYCRRLKTSFPAMTQCPWKPPATASR
jgi:hypothetical protein